MTTEDWEDSKEWIDYLKSPEFKEKIRKSIEKETWDKGLPKIYLKDGWIVKHWKDGRIEKIKKVG